MKGYDFYHQEYNMKIDHWTKYNLNLVFDKKILLFFLFFFVLLSLFFLDYEYNFQKAYFQVFFY